LLQEYNLKIRYWPGKENPVVTLYRHPVGRDGVNDSRQPVILSMMINVGGHITQLSNTNSIQNVKRAET